MGSRQIRRTDNGAQIVRVFNIIQQDQERVFASLLCKLQHIFHLCIGISRRIGDHALMLSGSAKLIQTFLLHILNQSILLLRFTYNTLNRTILASVQDQELIDGLSGTERLQDGIAPLDYVLISILFGIPVSFRLFFVHTLCLIILFLVFIHISANLIFQCIQSCLYQFQHPFPFLL